ncbi:MAG: exodeoxyribonuclease V subunit gamma, partial [Anaerolineales bacterium]|nr:exodeoxyribonuclease V subunit gamma [Anaerolineales bacterium]
GRPLGQNPAIDALLTLLKLFLPVSETEPEPKMPYHQLQQVWSSPYFAWEVMGLEPRHLRGLERAAVARQITGRQSRWESELQKWGATENGQPEVAEKFSAFLKLIDAPTKTTMRGYVIWLERLIGEVDGQPQLNSLNIALQAQQNPPTAERDLAALQALKNVLRELLQSSEMLRSAQLGYTDFLTDLLGIIDATRYKLPTAAEAITITSVIQARGLSFDVVALIGLAEGVFPATISEDPFLRDADREQLRQADLDIDDSTRSFEREYFYQMVGLPRQKLLLTRPTMTDDGAEWVPSAFWQEVGRVIDIEPLSLPNGQPRTAAEAASLPELFTYLAEVAQQEAQQWVDATHAEQMAQLAHSANVLAIRQTNNETFSPHDGLLSDIEADLRAAFGPQKVWSPTEFESYLTCPHFYFIGRVLNLSEPDQPDAELDVSHIGSIYHSLFQALYDKHGDAVAQAEEDELARWLAELAPDVFATAQHQLNFIPNAWWPQQQQEILHTAVKSIITLERTQRGYHTPRHEHRFDDVPITHPTEPERTLRIKGRIDRIDVDDKGTARLIDYKTGGSFGYKKDIANSKKIQLVLYALAAQADPHLDVELVTAALYWHIRQAEASDVPVSDSELMANGLQAAWDAAEHIQNGLFQPQVPDGGCPSYCPAAAFCWHYEPRF